MKITVGNLKMLIESKLNIDQSQEQKMFYSILHNLAQNQNGLRLTHEMPIKNVSSIEANGIQLLDHAISCFVGWGKY